MCCHDREVMNSNPSHVELGVHGTSILIRTLNQKYDSRTVIKVFTVNRPTVELFKMADN